MTAPAIPAQTVWLLLGGYLAAVLLNLHHIALWCLPVAMGACIWRARMRASPGGRSRPWLRNGIVIALTVAVFVAFRTLNGVQAGASLLVVMAALKLTETHARRDWLIIAGATLFLLLAACLDAQMLWRLPPYALELCLVCMGLYALGAGSAVPSLPALARRAASSMLAAIPFAVLLFLFVPRLTGSFWALPDEHQAVTGLTDEMNPGNISELSESGEPAARIRFIGTPPPPEQRYWRGFVLHQFDGSTWRRGHVGYAHPRGLVLTGTGYRYEVSMEPSPLPILLSLELPQHAPSAIPTAQLTDDYQLWNPDPPNHAIHYQLESHPQHRNEDDLSEAQRELDLDGYVKTRNPRSIELARALRAQSDSDIAFADRILDYFRRGGFRYALDPERLERDSVDDLLFRTREGFCGHYASAFALLMRAGGVPARVVTGYQGGQWNRYGGYLLVRQSDAHAWTEVWLQGVGWQRIDPTAVVAPSRLTRGADGLFPAGVSATQRVLRATWVLDVIQSWQAVDAWWQDEVVGFNFNKQQNLLEDLGLGQNALRALTSILIIGASTWLAALAWSLRPRAHPGAQDALKRSWLLLERKLRRAAAPRAAHEGVLDYAARVGCARPEIAATVNALAQRYARLRYGPAAQASEVQAFQRAVRMLPAVPAPAAAGRGAGGGR
jgi:transglutaminase-like putative cysteine protease